MRQLKLADLQARGISCEPAPQPIFFFPQPVGNDFPAEDAVIAKTSLREFASEEEAFTFLADKKGLMILDTPPVGLTLMAEAQDWRPGVFIKCWWPGAPEEANGRLGDPSDKPMVQALRATVILADLIARGMGDTEEARVYGKRLIAANDKLTGEERAECERRLPKINEWAQRCQENRKTLESLTKVDPPTS